MAVVPSFAEIRRHVIENEAEVRAALTEAGVDLAAALAEGDPTATLLALCQSHGIGPFSFDLPFDVPVFPDFREGASGDWFVEKSDVPLRRGYFTGVRPPVHPDYALKRRNADGTDVTWMSLSPMEVESMLAPVQNARGKVVLGGLGMGLWAMNLLANHKVKQLVVYERDDNVRAAFDALSDHANWPRGELMEIVPRSIFEPRAEDLIPDTLLLDIWPELGQPDALPDTLRASSAFGATFVGWWGQELDFMADLKVRAEEEWGGKLPLLNPRHWHDWMARLGLDVPTPAEIVSYMNLMDHVALNVTYMKWPRLHRHA